MSKTTPANEATTQAVSATQPPEGQAPTPASKKKAADKSEELVFVTVDTLFDTDREYIDVMVNGKAWRLRAGQRVEVPRKVLEVLQNAIGAQLDTSEGSLGASTTRVRPRFSFRAEI